MTDLMLVLPLRLDSNEENSANVVIFEMYWSLLNFLSRFGIRSTGQISFVKRVLVCMIIIKWIVMIFGLGLYMGENDNKVIEFAIILSYSILKTVKLFFDFLLVLSTASVLRTILNRLKLIFTLCVAYELAILLLSMSYMVKLNEKYMNFESTTFSKKIFIILTFLSMIYYTLFLCMLLVLAILVISRKRKILEKRFDRIKRLNASTKTMLFSEFKAFSQEVPDDMCCSICLYEFEPLDNLRILKCNHVFHARCIGKWINVKNECPLCRDNIIENLYIGDYSPLI